MSRKPLLILFALLPLCLPAQKQQSEFSTTEEKGEETTSRSRLFTGFSGGMMLHLGYAFAQSPDELFRNPSLMTDKNLPKSGVTMGIGGALRIHLLNHIHIGSEGFVSTMPLMKTGSQIRTGYGGILRLLRSLGQESPPDSRNNRRRRKYKPPICAIRRRESNRQRGQRRADHGIQCVLHQDTVFYA